MQLPQSEKHAVLVYLFAEIALPFFFPYFFFGICLAKCIFV